MQTRRTRVAVELIEAAGGRPLSELTPDERELADAEVSVAISEAAHRMSFADRLAAEGVTTVTLDVDGQLVERRPDGSTTVLTGPAL